MITLIKDLKDNDTIYQQFAITSITKSLATNGKPYIRLTLKDVSGTITAVKWNVDDSELNMCENGKIILVNGLLETYKNNLQININFIMPVDDKNIETFRFVKTSTKSKEELEKELDFYIKEIKDETLSKITSEIFKEYKDRFLIYPAAITIHHDYIGGLATHTLSMAKIAIELAKHYSFIDKDLLLAGVLLHDVAKTIEFEGDISFKYSLKGKLLGHISLMSAIVEETAKKLNLDNERSVLLQHLILSHHGEYEYGSPILPMTAEAILLNLIDNIDSKMEIIKKVLEETEKGEFSQKLFALDNRSVYKENK